MTQMTEMTHTFNPNDKSRDLGFGGVLGSARETSMTQGKNSPPISKISGEVKNQDLGAMTEMTEKASFWGVRRELKGKKGLFEDDGMTAMTGIPLIKITKTPKVRQSVRFSAQKRQKKLFSYLYK